MASPHYTFPAHYQLGHGDLDLHDHGLLAVPTPGSTPRAPIGPSGDSVVAYVPPPQGHGPRCLASGLEQLADAAIQAQPPLKVPLRAPKPAKKTRRRNATDAVGLLEQAYLRSPYISGLSQDERSQLALLTGMNIKQVQDWWRNRRGRSTKSGKVADEARAIVDAQFLAEPVQGSSRQRIASMPPGGPQKENGTHQELQDEHGPLFVNRLKSTFGLGRDLVHMSASRLHIGTFQYQATAVQGRPIGSLAFTVSEKERCIYYTCFVNQWLERVEIPLASVRSLDYTISAAGDEAQIKIHLTAPAICKAALAHPNHPAGPTRPINWLACQDFSDGQITTQLSHVIFLIDPATAAQELIRTAEAVPAFLSVISISSFRSEQDQHGNKLSSALPLHDFMPDARSAPLPYHVGASGHRMVDFGPLTALPSRPYAPPSTIRPSLPSIATAFGPFSV